MKKKIVFFLAGPKAFSCLQFFCKTFGPEIIHKVYSYKSLENFWFNDLKFFCSKNKILFSNSTVSLKEDNQFLKFAIGWQYLIKNYENLIIFHDSLLPKYKGFAPLVNGLINGDKIFGVTSLIASKKYDEGDIIYQNKITIKYPIKIQDLIEKIIPLYHKQLNKIYTNYLNSKKILQKKQKKTTETYGIWLNDNDYFIDWSWPSEKIFNFINAVGYPYKFARTRFFDDILIIKDSKIIGDKFIVNRERHIGKIFSVFERSFTVICGQGLLMITDYSFPNKSKTININLRTKFDY